MPSPLGMELTGAGVVGAGVGDGLGIGAGVDDLAIWSPVFLFSGCLAVVFISVFGVDFFNSALLVSCFAPGFFSASLPLLAASLSLSGFRVVLAELCF